MKLYIAVTADRYELPICVTDNVPSLAKMLGVKTNSLHTQLSRGEERTGGKSGYTVMKVEVEDD